MMKKEWMVLFAALLFSTAVSFAASGSSKMKLRVYVNQSRFYGRYFVKNHRIYVKADSFKNILYLPSNYFFPKRIEVMFHGNSYVNLQAYARQNRDTVLTNWSTGIVNLFTVPLSQVSQPSVYQSAPAYQTAAPVYQTVPVYQTTVPVSEAYTPGPTIVVPPSSYSDRSWCLIHICSPITHRPEAVLPPPALTLEPLVGNPWYNYPSYAPDPYYSSYNPSMYSNYYNGYGGYYNGYPGTGYPVGGYPAGGPIYP